MKQILMTLTLLAGVGMMNQVSAQHRLKKDPVKQTKVVKNLDKVEHAQVQVVKYDKFKTVKLEKRTLDHTACQKLSPGKVRAKQDVKYRDPKRNKVYRD